MRKSKFTDSQIMAVLKRVEVGEAVPDLCRELTTSTATFYKCRAKYEETSRGREPSPAQDVHGQEAQCRDRGGGSRKNGEAISPA